MVSDKEHLCTVLFVVPMLWFDCMFAFKIHKQFIVKEKVDVFLFINAALKEAFTPKI